MTLFFRSCVHHNLTLQSEVPHHGATEDTWFWVVIWFVLWRKLTNNDQRWCVSELDMFSTYGPGPRHSRRVHLCYMRNLLASEIYFPIHVHLRTASKKVKYVNILLRDWKVHVVYGWHILQSSRSMIFSHGSFTLCRARCLIMKGNFCSFHCVVKSCHWKM